MSPKTNVRPWEDALPAAATPPARQDPALHVVHPRRPLDARPDADVRSAHTTVFTGRPGIVAQDAAPAAPGHQPGNSDLIVLDTRGAGYWSPGSFAAAFGRAVQCPTIVVPQNGPRVHSGTLFRRILCSIDFSEVSTRVLARALALAQRSAGRVTLLHVMQDFPFEIVYSGARAFQLLRERRERIERLEAELRLLIPPDASRWCEIDVETVPGKSHETILSVAAERRADLIAMGLPRRARLEQFLAGSTVKKVLRRAASPVLLVPDA